MFERPEVLWLLLAAPLVVAPGLMAVREEFGKDHETAVAWVLGTDQRNADLVATTRDRADLVVLAVFIRSGLSENTRHTSPLLMTGRSLP